MDVFGPEFDTFWPFDNRTCSVLGWLLHSGDLNTKIVEYSYHGPLSCIWWSNIQIGSTNCKEMPGMLDYFVHYSGDLKSRLVQISNVWKEVGFQMIWILFAIWNSECQPFKILTNGGHFVQKSFEIWTKMSRFWMVWF